MRDWLPWYRIAWNLLWVVPIYFFRIGFVFFVGVAFGPGSVSKAWGATE